jgi:hypothetical protein
VDKRSVVEQQTLHGRVVDEEKVTLAAELADRKPIPSSM